MRLFRIFIIVLLFAAAGVGFYLYEDTKLPPQAQPLRPAATTTGSVTTPPPEPEVTLEEMVGELFMVGHWAETPVASTSELIDTYHLGSVVIMSVPEDPTEIRSWVRTWNASSTRPLFIAIDQEGGSVSRLKGPTFIQTSQREIISTSSAYQVGLVRGKELEKLGINLNLAPVLDYASTTDSFMYQRSFASRELTADMAGAMIAGMSESGVIG
ncbi:hypothetical protein KC906_00195, partial [Candidatus Kaiserbacteria bacterium]|nr:hypothetical protein [Candidatus Kaiserbacteria bacterium]